MGGGVGWGWGLGGRHLARDGEELAGGQRLGSGAQQVEERLRAEPVTTHGARAQQCTERRVHGVAGQRVWPWAGLEEDAQVVRLHAATEEADDVVVPVGGRRAGGGVCSTPG